MKTGSATIGAVRLARGGKMQERSARRVRGRTPALSPACWLSGPNLTGHLVRAVLILPRSRAMMWAWLSVTGIELAIWM
jgi:hypothetical protein